MGRRWLLVALAVSVGLNLFLLGVGATVWTQRQRLASPPAPASVMKAAEQLDPADRAAFRKLLRREGRRISPDLKAARAARRDAARKLADATYDRAAVAADLATARAAEARARAQLETAVLQFAEGLDQTERAALARAVKRGLDTNRRALRGGRGGRNRDREAVQDVAAESR
jgi:uncharacterized membrane protein